MTESEEKDQLLEDLDRIAQKNQARREEHLTKVAKITSPRFDSIKERLLRRLGVSTYRWNNGAWLCPPDWHNGEMSGIMVSLKIVEEEFIKGE